MNFRRLLLGGALPSMLAFGSACQPGVPDAQGGSQTNWLKRCDSSSQCGGLECFCGLCTTPCSEDDECAALPGGACLRAGDKRAIAACDGVLPTTGMCLATCGGECPEGTDCVAGSCAPAYQPTTTVSIDSATQYQTLLGFGASLSHDDDLIAGYPDKERLFDVMFVESGFDAVRIRNRYEPGNEPALASAAEIVRAATARLGHAPMLFLASGSPPRSLKANGQRSCAKSDVNCTLAHNGGNFDYGGFAEHWRASLEAYETRGIHPDFVSIQSNPDWLPEEEAVEACHFLPQEGRASVKTSDGQVLEAQFPGYAQAMQAVVAAASTLPAQYSFSGPEVGNAAALQAYSTALADVESVAYHLYDTDPKAVAVEELEAVGALSDQLGMQSIQSAVQADGLGTAILAHYALAVVGSTGYLQQQFVAPTFDETSTALIGVNEGTIEKLPAYHALSHYSRFIEPGWVRVAAVIDAPGVLASAWSSPDGGALTVVLVNPTDVPVEVELAPRSAVDLGNARVVRTVFNGVERSAELGVLSQKRVVRVPGNAIVTVATPSD